MALTNDPVANVGLTSSNTCRFCGAIIKRVLPSGAEVIIKGVGQICRWSRLPECVSCANTWCQEGK